MAYWCDWCRSAPVAPVNELFAYASAKLGRVYALGGGLDQWESPHDSINELGLTAVRLQNYLD